MVFEIIRDHRHLGVHTEMLTDRMVELYRAEALYSGIGGQVHFIRGAARSRGGRPIIALPSTARNGAVGRTVPTLSSGAGVVTSCGDVHHVVTEYVRVDLKPLISIAHRDFSRGARPEGA